MENTKLLSIEEKKKIIAELNKKLPRLKCPMCGNEKFIIADGYFNQTMQGELKGMVLGGTSLPSIAFVCDNCGFISQHAVGVLGLLPPQNENGKP